MGTSLYLKQVLVENNDGVQYCDAFGTDVKYSPLSESLSIPGHTETVTLVKLGDLGMPVIKVTEAFGENRQVSTFVPVLAHAAEGLLDGLKPSSMVRISLTNGTPIVTVGDPTGLRCSPRRGPSSSLRSRSPARSRCGPRPRCLSRWCAPTTPTSMSASPSSPA